MRIRLNLLTNAKYKDKKNEVQYRFYVKCLYLIQ